MGRASGWGGLLTLVGLLSLVLTGISVDLAVFFHQVIQ